MLDVVTLILLVGSPDATGVAVVESLKFLSKLLMLAQRGEQTPCLDGLVAQVNSMGHVEQAKVCNQVLTALPMVFIPLNFCKFLSCKLFFFFL